jgi:hypothetical protein
VRGARGGSVYRWTVDNGGAGGHRYELATGTSVLVSVAKRRAELAARRQP